MSYIKRNLGYGERVLYFTRITSFVWVPWLVFAIAFGLAASMVTGQHRAFLALGAAAVLCLVQMLRRMVFYLTSEFAITDRRVFGKVGFTDITSVDIMLTKVESVRVDQDLTGQIFNYGDVAVTGTGGTGEILTLVRNPALFRSKLEAAIG